MNKIVLYMGTFPPRECGIATFTKDFVTAMDKNFSPEVVSRIVAMNNGVCQSLDYPPEVIFQINEIHIKEYIKIAKKINKDASIKAISIQHEFGIFGGKFLNYLSAFLETIKKPVFITFHSVVPSPPDNIRSIIRYLALKAQGLIVMADKAVEILNNDYGINDKVTIIHHGIHEVQYEKSMVQKEKLGYSDKLILSSFGLISGSKSYETIVEALPEVVKKFPNVLLLIIGRTHPGIYKDEGEKYRNRIKRLVRKLNLQDNVKFINKYVELNELLQYLRATDIFVSSGRGLGQIVSGTLAYAMGCGRPVVTIPFVHAKEAVTEDRGILVDVGDSKGYRDAIIKLLSDQELMEEMGRNAYEYTRHMLWRNVADSYMDVFKRHM